jgi:hypothetical protein
MQLSYYNQLATVLKILIFKVKWQSCQPKYHKLDASVSNLLKGEERTHEKSHISEKCLLAT